MVHIKQKLLLAFVLFVLSACTTSNDSTLEANRYVPPDVAPDAAATLVMGPPDTGFLNIGNTGIGIVSVDGEPLVGSYPSPLLYAPGEHTFLFRAFRDPWAAYACVTLMLEKDKSYIARTTEPSSETTIWIEDQSTGEVVGRKYKATMFKEPLMYTVGPLVAMLVQNMYKHPMPPCPAPPTPSRPTGSAPGAS